jgi:cytochrome c oxidase subunit 2
MAAAQVPAGDGSRRELTDRQHVMRIGAIWLVSSVICSALVYFAWGPHMPPGTDSLQARGQQFDNTVLATVATPVILFIWVYFAYVLLNWRVKANTPVSELQDGPAIKGHLGFQATWMVVTGVTVLSMFVFGTYELVKDSGSGTGSGQAPIWTPAGYSVDPAQNKLLVVQAIGQQWRWTFRYPQFGGIETSDLVIPVGAKIEYSVTSLDVIHSFWETNLGVKADANPGVNNIAFGEATKIGSIDIRCAELCGIWHGAMFSTGQVVSRNDFQAWIADQQFKHQDLVAFLPPYADFYLPQSDGGYYDPAVNPLPAPPGPTPAATPTVIP